LKNCIIIDESPVIRKVAKRILKDLNFSINEAASGQEALSKISLNFQDVIMLDHAIYDMTPVEFIQSALRHSTSIKPSILLCVTRRDVVSIMKAKRAGASGYLFKPFTRETLLQSFSSQIAELAA
jgi:two-component system, chemotaxis family, chemotaxis protein CheY